MTTGRVAALCGFGRRRGRALFGLQHRIYTEMTVLQHAEPVNGAAPEKRLVAHSLPRKVRPGRLLQCILPHDAFVNSDD